MDEADKRTMEMADDQEEQTRISVPGDTVQIALSRLVTNGDLTEDGKSTVWWFYGHARDRGMSLGDAGKCIDRDGTTVSRLFNGRYPASYEHLVAEITRYRKLSEERAKRKDIGFIETSIFRKISVVCRGALFDAMPAYIYGDSQIGKSFCLEEYARRNNHGQTRYIRMPAAPTFRGVLRLFSDACFLSDRLNEEDLRRRIFKAIGDNTLVIVDEFHQVFTGAGEMTQRKIIEFVREVYDRTHCGIVICGTRVVQEQFERGSQKLVWEQFRRRGMVELVLPGTPPRSDVLKIAAAFGIGEPDTATMETIREMLTRSGIGMYFKFLQQAHGLAVSRKTALTWDHFTQAYKSIKALSQN